MKFTINGDEALAHDDCTDIDYEEVLSRTALTGNPSMTYSYGGNSGGGILSPGKHCRLAEGMRFSVCHTGNA